MVEKQEHYLISVKRHGIKAVKRKRSRQMLRQWLILLIPLLYPLLFRSGEGLQYTILLLFACYVLLILHLSA